MKIYTILYRSNYIIQPKAILLMQALRRGKGIYLSVLTASDLFLRGNLFNYLIIAVNVMCFLMNVIVGSPPP